MGGMPVVFAPPPPRPRLPPRPPLALAPYPSLGPRPIHLAALAGTPPPALPSNFSSLCLPFPTRSPRLVFPVGTRPSPATLHRPPVPHPPALRRSDSPAAAAARVRLAGGPARSPVGPVGAGRGGCADASAGTGGRQARASGGASTKPWASPPGASTVCAKPPNLPSALMARARHRGSIWRRSSPRL